MMKIGALVAALAAATALCGPVAAAPLTPGGVAISAVPGTELAQKHYGKGYHKSYGHAHKSKRYKKAKVVCSKKRVKTYSKHHGHHIWTVRRVCRTPAYTH